MSEEISPAVLRRWIRSEMRRRREAAGYDQKDAARRLSCAPSRISHLESGRNLPDRATVEVLFGFYRCADDIVSFLERVQQAEGAKKVDIANTDPNRFDLYAGLEEGATEKHTADLMALNGLVQTPGYIDTVLRFHDPNATHAEIARRRQLRLQRQAALTRARNPLKLWMIIPEHLLDDNVGGPDVMRAQLEHLLELGALPNVEMQVLHKGTGGHRAVHGPFAILKFPIPEDLGLVYVDTAIKGIFFEEPDEIGRYEEIMNHLRAAALPQGESRLLIDKLRKDIM